MIKPAIYLGYSHTATELSQLLIHVLLDVVFHQSNSMTHGVQSLDQIAPYTLFRTDTFYTRHPSRKNVSVDYISLLVD